MNTQKEEKCSQFHCIEMCPDMCKNCSPAKENMNQKEELNSWEEMKEKLRDEFEDLFPKDIEATMGIRSSVSHRSEALVLWAKWEMILRVCEREWRSKWVKEKQNSQAELSSNS